MTFRSYNFGNIIRCLTWQCIDNKSDMHDGLLDFVELGWKLCLLPVGKILEQTIIVHKNFFFLKLEMTLPSTYWPENKSHACGQTLTIQDIRVDRAIHEVFWASAPLFHDLQRNVKCGLLMGKGSGTLSQRKEQCHSRKCYFNFFGL